LGTTFFGCVPPFTTYTGGTVTVTGLVGQVTSVT
jgi:hypothetical protein